MKKKRVLALDYGKKRVGTAGGDTVNRMAFPKGMILNKNRSFLIEEIGKIVKNENIDFILIGLPLAMEAQQSENKILKEVQDFAGLLKKNLGIEVEMFDERLSTFEAETLMKETGKSPLKERGLKDAISAQIILQRFFDTLDN
ncbi:MAG: Holliday junction resolvase RuvX [Candidatus Gracilibacteria bacterium]